MLSQETGGLGSLDLCHNLMNDVLEACLGSYSMVLLAVLSNRCKETADGAGSGDARAYSKAYPIH